MKPFIIIVKRRLRQKCVLIIYPFFSMAQTKNSTSHSLLNGDSDGSGSSNKKAYITPFLSNPIEYQKYAFMLKSFQNV